MSNLLGAITHVKDSTIQRQVSQEIGSNIFSINKPQGVFQSNKPILEQKGFCISGVINWFSAGSNYFKTGNANRSEHLLQNFLNCWIQQEYRMLETLDGEFAIIIWFYSSQEIWIIRDIFGSEPLHYFEKKDHLIFASNARRLWPISPTPLKINNDRILDFIVDDLEHADQTSTFKQGIFKTSIGSINHWKNGLLTSKQYWHPKINENYASHSEDQILGQFQELLGNAISKRLRSSEPTGLTLSGGLDSNTILSCWPQELINDGISENHLFSLIPEKENRSDPESTMLLSQKGCHGKIPHHWITPSNALEQIGPAEEFIHALEDPFAIHSLSGPAPCYKMASDYGIISVIDGIDGDMVAGIPSNYWRFLLGKNQIKSSITECFHHYIREGATIWGAFYEISKMVLNKIFPPLRKCRNFLSSPNDTNNNEAAYLLRKLPLNQNKFSQSHISHRIKLLKQNQHPSRPKTIEQSIINGLKSPMLAVAVDRYHLAATHFKVKAIHPLLDRNLIEFVLGLQWKYRAFKGAPKHLFRQQLRTKGLELLANQNELGHVGPWFTETFMRDYFKRHPKPNSENLDALSDYVDINKYLNSYIEINRVNCFNNPNENVWELTMLSEWLIKNE